MQERLGPVQDESQHAAAPYLRAALCRVVLAIGGAFGLFNQTFADVRIADSREAGFDYNFQPGDERKVVVIEGKISVRDVHALSAALTKAGGVFVSEHANLPLTAVVLDSGGGDVESAIKMGRILRERLAVAHVQKGARCDSACVLVFVGAVEKHIHDDAKLGLHRIYFDPELFANLNLEDARRVYAADEGAVRIYLDEMRVRQSTMDAMLQVPSNQVWRVGPSEAGRLGLMGVDPAFEEWDRARLVSSCAPEYVRALELCKIGPEHQEACDLANGMRKLACKLDANGRYDPKGTDGRQ